jgi:hypothetical protein
MTDRPTPSQVEENRSGSASRLIAILVLIPTTPAWLLSMVALALFYLAPGRFGALLNRLPGDDIIRSALAFAPATLLAIVILASLYALDRPQISEPKAPGTRVSLQGMAQSMLLLLAPLTVISLSGLAISFIAPDRFWSRLEVLPGQRYLDVAVSWSPPFLLLVMLIALTLSLRKTDRSHRLSSIAVWLGTLVSAILASTFVLGLVLLQLSPSQFDTLIGRFPGDSFDRLSMLAIPAAAWLAAQLGFLLLSMRGKRDNQMLEGLLSLGVLALATSLIGIGGAGLVMLLR